MEVAGSEQRSSIVALYELLGTCLFVYMIIMSTGNAVTVPLALFSVIIIFGDITGGHFNPAVTLGVYVQLGEYKKNAAMCAIIIFSQLVGSFIGMGLAILTLASNVDGDYQVPEQYVPKLCPKNPARPDECQTYQFNLDFQIWLTQAICTFVFVSVILMIKGKYTSPSTDGALKALAVVFTLGGLIHVANHTAASFNPAVTSGLTAFQNYVLVNKNEYLTRYLTPYFFGPLLGGALAGLFSLTHHDLHKPVPAKAETQEPVDQEKAAQKKSSFTGANMAQQEPEDPLLVKTKTMKDITV